MLDQVLSISSSKIKVLRQFYRRSFEVKRQPFRDRSFILEWGGVGGGEQFPIRLDFGGSIVKMHKM